jgi:hypothetical protein
MAKLFSKFLGKFFFVAAAALFVACGDDSSSSGPEGGESSAVEESSSSIEVSSSSVNGDSGSGAGMTLLSSFVYSPLRRAFYRLSHLIRAFEFAGVDDEHLQAVLDVCETGIRIVVEAQDLHVRATFLHSLREATATDVVREAGERLHNDEAVDAVLRVVKDFCRDEPAFTRVVRRVDNTVDVVHEFKAVCVVFVELERLHNLIGCCCGVFKEL